MGRDGLSGAGRPAAHESPLTRFPLHAHDLSRSFTGGLLRTPGAASRLEGWSVTGKKQSVIGHPGGWGPRLDQRLQGEPTAPTTTLCILTLPPPPASELRGRAWGPEVHSSDAQKTRRCAGRQRTHCRMDGGTRPGPGPSLLDRQTAGERGRRQRRIKGSRTRLNTGETRPWGWRRCPGQRAQGPRTRRVQRVGLEDLDQHVAGEAAPPEPAPSKAHLSSSCTSFLLFPLPGTTRDQSVIFVMCYFSFLSHLL